MADNLLEKASILLTPTAYNDGRMLSVKPNENLYGSELVTNGDFSNGLADWVVDDGTSWTNVNNTAFCDGNNGLIKQNITSAQNKIYKVTFDTIATNSSGKELGVRIDGGTYSWNLYPTGTHTIYLTAGSANSEGVLFYAINGWTGSIDNISVVEDLSGDFTFSRGSAATRVNEQGLVEEITDINLPRIDYTDGCGSWLLEPQSTNLYLNSDTLVTQSNATSASTYTVSFYGTGTITFSGTHTGTLVGTGVNDRVSVTFTATSGTLTSTISGTCTKGQLENLSYATSYIPTNGAIATRLADVANNSGNASLINSTEGVLYAEIAALENGSSIKIIELNDGTSSNRVFVYLRNDRITYEVKSNGITSAGGTYDNLGVLNFHKIAVKWKDNDFALWLDGAKVLSDTSGSSPLALDRINFTDPFGGIPFYGKCKALAVYKEALTDAELQSLTTI